MIRERAPDRANQTDDARWARVAARDRAARDFVYAVSSTGIYCLPGCASRLPRRENVRFFDTPGLAEAAGFRPCRRCLGGAARTTPDAAMQAVRAALDEALLQGDAPPTLEALATLAGLGPSHLRRRFRAAFGVTPREYHAVRRLHRFADSLAPTDSATSVTDRLYAAGYGSGSRLYEESGSLGLAPSVLTSGGKGAAVRYAFGRTSLGLVLVAATAQGLCRVAFGENEEELLAELRRRLPRATLDFAPDDLAVWTEAVAAFVERPAGRPALPLDVAGTLFQRRVWKALSEVPAGETVSYGELARRIGSPGASRAVGAACGANPLAVIIPCHRAVGGTGRLTGYRWGVARKKELLRREEELAAQANDAD